MCFHQRFGLLVSSFEQLSYMSFTWRIREQMERMLVAASTRLLTNIALSIADLASGCEVWISLLQSKLQ
jgi:hypothetical protein